MVHNIELEQFDSFKYLDSVVNQDTAIEQEVKGRKAAGNKVFYANKRTMFSKLLTKISVMRFYRSLLRPVVKYGCDTWVLKDVVGKHSERLNRKQWGRYTTLQEIKIGF